MLVRLHFLLSVFQQELLFLFHVKRSCKSSCLFCSNFSGVYSGSCWILLALFYCPAIADLSRTVDAMLINGAAGAVALGSPNSIGAGITVVVVSGDILSNIADFNRRNIMLVNATSSSLGTPCDGSAVMGANGTVGGAEPSSISIGEISVLLFVLSMFDIRDGGRVL